MRQFVTGRGQEHCCKAQHERSSGDRERLVDSRANTNGPFVRLGRIDGRFWFRVRRSRWRCLGRSTVFTIGGDQQKNHLDRSGCCLIDQFFQLGRSVSG